MAPVDVTKDTEGEARFSAFLERTKNDKQTKRGFPLRGRNRENDILNLK